MLFKSCARISGFKHALSYMIANDYILNPMKASIQFNEQDGSSV